MRRRDITREVMRHHAVSFHSGEFRLFWELGYTIVAIEDTDTTIPLLMGDMYDPEVNTDVAPEELKKQERAFKKRIRNEGVWGCGLAKPSAPDYTTFVWGLVGMDYLGSGYDRELLESMRELYHSLQSR